jgi:plastocyanin
MSARTAPLLALSAAALATAVAGCGGGGSTLAASAGKIKIVMGNPSQLSHSIAIAGNGVNAAGQVVGPHGTSTVSATLKPGRYTFFCTVPGHRQAGMQGTLTVK